MYMINLHHSVAALVSYMSVCCLLSLFFPTFMVTGEYVNINLQSTASNFHFISAHLRNFVRSRSFVDFLSVRPSIRLSVCQTVDCDKTK